MALPALILFAVADGLFNLWDVQRVVKDPALQGAATIYGIFPTLAVALLGALQGFVDRIPTPPRPQRGRSLLEQAENNLPLAEYTPILQRVQRELGLPEFAPKPGAIPEALAQLPTPTPTATARA